MQLQTPNPLCSFVSFVVLVLVLIFNYQITNLPNYQFLLTTSLSSTTSSGHSGQLCSQQTITSQPLGSCPWIRKFRLSYSNSIRTRWHMPPSIRRNPSPSGNAPWMRDNTYPSSSHKAPKRKITPS